MDITYEMKQVFKIFFMFSHNAIQKGFSSSYVLFLNCFGNSNVNAVS